MIQFTQYLRPNGATKQVEIDRPAPIEMAALALRKLGCKFEIEELTTHEVSMTIEYKDMLMAIKVVPNGPEVPPAVDQLITEADERLQYIKEI
jgi:hypothetical protein